MPLQTDHELGIRSAEDHMLCGLRVQSALPLPELLPWRGDDRPADLIVRLGSVPDRLTEGPPPHPLVEIAMDGRCRFALATVGAYLVAADGRMVTIAPAAGADEAEVRLFLFGTVFAIVCQRRGLLPLHACCVRIGDQAVAFAGSSGIGKSTLAARLWQRGYAVLADDITVIDFKTAGRAMVLPSFPRIKLWRDSLDGLGQGVADLTVVRPSIDKYHLPITDGFCSTPLPLKGLVQLEKKSHRSAGLHQLSATESLARLNKFLYRPRLMLRLSTMAAQMSQIMLLMAAVHGLRLLPRPESPAEWDQLEALLPGLAG